MLSVHNLKSYGHDVKKRKMNRPCIMIFLITRYPNFHNMKCKRVWKWAVDSEHFVLPQLNYVHFRVRTSVGCIVRSSAASFLVWGGQDAQMCRQKSCTCNLHARANEASERLRNIYIFMSENTSVYIYYDQCSSPCITCGMDAINDSIPTKH